MKRTDTPLTLDEKHEAWEIADEIEIAAKHTQLANDALNDPTLDDLRTAYTFLIGESERIANAKTELHALIERIERG
jgi:hypothetical protein